MLSYALTAEPNAIRPAAHLLTNWVLKRSFAYILAWPFTGRPPVAVNAPVARRGPSPDAPVLTAAEKARFFEHLRVTAERSLTDRELDEAAARCFDAMSITRCRGIGALTRQRGSRR